MSGWGRGEWEADFNEATARRIAEHEAARAAQAARRAVHVALVLAGLVAAIMFGLAWVWGQP